MITLIWVYATGLGLPRLEVIQGEVPQILCKLAYRDNKIYTFTT